MMIDDSFFWIKRNRLAIPGVQGEHVFLHITDTHVLATDEQSTPEELEKAEEKTALWKTYKEKFARANGEPYGEAQKISSCEAFEKLLALAEELKPEALLLSGDNCEYTSPSGTRYLEKTLGAYSGKFLCVPGNHEDPECGSLWRPGVQTLDFDGFRIAAVDNSRKTVSRADLDALRALCDEKVPLIVMCHVPLSTPTCKELCKEKLTGQNEYFYLDSETEDANGREFVSLCMTNETIRAVLCGHVHGYYSMELVPGKPQIIGSHGMIGAAHILTVC